MVKGKKSGVKAKDNGYNQQMLDDVTRADTRLGDKQMLGKEIKQIEELKRRTNEEYSNICMEFNNKEKSLTYLNSEISAQTHTLNMVKDDIAKEKESEYKWIEKRMKEVDEAHGIYQKLCLDNSNMQAELRNKIHAIDLRERRITEENENLHLHVERANGEMGALRYDTAALIDAFDEEKAVFEEHKKSLAPTLDRLSSIKRENESLLEKIENEQEGSARQREVFKHEQEKVHAELESEQVKIRRSEQVLEKQLEEMKARKENLDDFELELKAMEAKVNKDIKRFQLKKVIKDSEGT